MVRKIEDSPLVAFFPTVVPTHLGFLVQGPYQTTPSRDNVPAHERWNQYLVQETGDLLVEALRGLRDHGYLDADALGCLPLDPNKFGEHSMFRPLFEATKEALSSEALLPTSDGGHVPAERAMIGRTRDLRDLLSPGQLGSLFEEDDEVSWVTGDITQDRTPELRKYLMGELGVPEMTRDTLLYRLGESFLESQPDHWIRRLYEYLNGQPGLHRPPSRVRLHRCPLLRLEDGSQVSPYQGGEPQAFLPADIHTGFPTVRRSVCASDDALEFLRSLGLAEPDLIDDVVYNVLPTYLEDEVAVTPSEYRRDIDRILHADRTDSAQQRERLIAKVREARFVKAVDAATGSIRFARPDTVYWPTESLLTLFEGVAGVLFIDQREEALQGEAIRKLLERCETLPYLRPVSDRSLRSDHDALRKLREEAGHAETSGQNDRVQDWGIQGLEELLQHLLELEPVQRKLKARTLWQELIRLCDRRKGVFKAIYTWTHYGTYRADTASAFVRTLNETPWIPDEDGNLHCPHSVLFEDLDWEPDPFLESKIDFKSPAIEDLAREAGIDAGALEILKEAGLTSADELRERLGLDQTPTTPGVDGDGEGGRGDGGRTGGRPPTGRDGGGPPGASQLGTGGGKPGPPRHEGNGGGSRRFISFVAVSPDEDADPDGLSAPDRRELEETAITFILTREPDWHRTEPLNPGFDLYRTNDRDEVIGWCEVKAMSGTLEERPVGLSHTQFEYAQERGEAYLLYVVERAGSEDPELVRVRNPAGQARTFTFDRGWREIAETDV